MNNIDSNDPYATVNEDLIMQKVAEKYGISTEEANKICMKVSLYKVK